LLSVLFTICEAYRLENSTARKNKYLINEIVGTKIRKLRKQKTPDNVRIIIAQLSTYKKTTSKIEVVN